MATARFAVGQPGSQRRRAGLVVAAVAAIVVCLLLLAPGGREGGTLQAALSAAAQPRVHICPPCTEALACPPAPECPLQCPPPAPAASRAEEAAPTQPEPKTVWVESESHGKLVCAGPEGIPLVADALEAASAAMHASVEESFAQWEGKGFTLEDLMETARRLRIQGTHDTMVWVEVRKGRVTFPRRHNGECRWFCNEWVAPLIDVWNAALADGRLRVPEGVPFLWNVYDHPGCPEGDAPGESVCTAPLLSIIKHATTFDVMVPPFPTTPRPFEPVFVPWSEKRDVAFFRGSPWCSVHPLNGTKFKKDSNCSRESLSILSDHHTDLLNVSITRPYGRATAKEGELATHYEHAHYKYLLQLDGITASRRFRTLLSMNSLVLKQASLYWEWYYHALQPCVHYLPFWQTSEDDILEMMRTLRSHPRNELTAQRIAANAQAFAAAWLDEDGRLRYWQLVVDKYVQLFKGSTNAATVAAKLQAEQFGQQASKVGSTVDDKCLNEGGDACFAVGMDAANAELDRLMAEAAGKAAAGAPGGGEQQAAAGEAAKPAEAQPAASEQQPSGEAAAAGEQQAAAEQQAAPKQKAAMDPDLAAAAAAVKAAASTAGLAQVVGVKVPEN